MGSDMQGVWVYEIKELNTRGEQIGLEQRGRWTRKAVTTIVRVVFFFLND